MAKGIPGFALPGLVALLYLWACDRWSLLLEGRLKIALGAAALRHGRACPGSSRCTCATAPPFTNRLLVHDHLNRLTKGVHGDTGSDRVLHRAARLRVVPVDRARAARARQLAAAARASGGTRSPHAQRRRDSAVLIGLWFVVRVHALQRDDHEVPPLHLPGGAASRDPDRRGARSHARRAERSAARSAARARAAAFCASRCSRRCRSCSAWPGCAVICAACCRQGYRPASRRSGPCSIVAAAARAGAG